MSESRGLGDTIAKVTEALGISPCGGCKERRDWLNEKFPYERDRMNPPVTRVNDIAEVKAGCIHFPTPQPITVGCPVCGMIMQVTPQDGAVTTGKITLPMRLKFPCGWSGMLINSEWIGKNA